MDNQPQIQPQPPQEPRPQSAPDPPEQILAQSMPPSTSSTGPKHLGIIIVAIGLGVLIIAAFIFTLAVAGTTKHTDQGSNKKTAPANSGSAYSKLQVGGGSQYARDSKRRTDLPSIQVQLEPYFDQTGNYPSFAEFNSPAWRNANMKDLDPGSLEDPLSSCDASQKGCLANKPTRGAYSYQVTDAQGKSCESDPAQCAKYTLTATLEDTSYGNTFTKTSLD